jgi:hypothetical protein
MGGIYSLFEREFPNFRIIILSTKRIPVTWLKTVMTSQSDVAFPTFAHRNNTNKQCTTWLARLVLFLIEPKIAT